MKEHGKKAKINNKFQLTCKLITNNVIVVNYKLRLNVFSKKMTVNNNL